MAVLARAPRQKANLQYSILPPLIGLFRTSLTSDEGPIRAELFGVERLEQHAESLAAAQPVTTRSKTGRRLAARLRENGRVLLDAYREIAVAIRDERATTPAAEWLVDNFHVVEEQIREIRDDLPRGFYVDKKNRALRIARAVVIKIVEPRLADSDDAGVCAVGKIVNAERKIFFRFVRMRADAAPDIVVAVGDCAHRVERRNLIANG